MNRQPADVEPMAADHAHHDMPGTGDAATSEHHGEPGTAHGGPAGHEGHGGHDKHAGHDAGDVPAPVLVEPAADASRSS